MSTHLVGPLIAFSGSRKFRDRALVEKVMDRLILRWPECLIRVGDARDGLDPMVAESAISHGKVPDVQECYWPPWPSTKAQRAEAANERNGRVVQDADCLIAFFAPGPKSNGTSNAIRQAKRRGIVVYVYHEGHWSIIAPQGDSPDAPQGILESVA
jgi:hypothetical protein